MLHSRLLHECFGEGSGQKWFSGHKKACQDFGSPFPSRKQTFEGWKILSSHTIGNRRLGKCSHAFGADAGSFLQESILALGHCADAGARPCRMPHRLHVLLLTAPRGGEQLVGGRTESHSTHSPTLHHQGCMEERALGMALSDGCMDGLLSALHPMDAPGDMPHGHLLCSNTIEPTDILHTVLQTLTQE